MIRHRNARCSTTHKSKRRSKPLARRDWVDTLESRVLLTAMPPPIQDISWTTGTKDLLYIRTAYADSPTVMLQPLAQAQENMAAAGKFFQDNSYGTLTLRPTF